MVSGEIDRAAQVAVGTEFTHTSPIQCRGQGIAPTNQRAAVLQPLDAALGRSETPIRVGPGLQDGRGALFMIELVLHPPRDLRLAAGGVVVDEDAVVREQLGIMLLGKRPVGVRKAKSERGPPRFQMT